MYKIIHSALITAVLATTVSPSSAQNIAVDERVQVLGTFNGYAATPYAADYRTTTYRRLSTTMGSPTDGRGQWSTMLNVQSSGGNITPVNLPGGAGNGFIFASGPATNRTQNKWSFGSVAQAAKDAVNAISCYNACSNDMGLNMGSTGYYTVNFNDCGYTQTNAHYYIGYTSAPPVQPRQTSELLNPDGTVSVNISTSAPASAQEKIYVRYTTDADFSGTSTSNIVEATLLGNTYTAIIPSFVNSVLVRYYVFTSTRTRAQLMADGELQRSLSVLKYDDNNGQNFSYTANVLPVIVNFFAGTMNEDRINIKWVAEQEINMLHYELYKSNNGVAFTLLGTIGSGGNSSRTEYNFTDDHPNSLGNYYRLICVNRDGKRSVTKIIKVNYTSINNQLTIYPNPVEKDLNISVAGMQRGQYRINIYGDGGQMVYAQPYDHNGFDKTLHLVLPETIKTGPYRIYISNQYEFYKGTFIVR